MRLIADSGSSKTDWRLINEEGLQHSCATSGINPYFMSSDTISSILHSELKINTDAARVKEVFFYGAGCSNKEKCDKVAKILKTLFPEAEISVCTDMLGAARAVCGNKPGIAAILGTGSNSCFYNGSTIAFKVPSYGYLFGDEGSGAYLGKLFISAYLHKKLPIHLISAFEEEYGLTAEKILEAVYSQPNPNSFLASFSIFLHKVIKEPSIESIVRQGFTDFFDKQIDQYTDYKNLPLGVVGSVGFSFSEILKSVALDKVVKISKIIQSPIAALTVFHQN